MFYLLIAVHMLAVIWDVLNLKNSPAIKGAQV